MTNTRASGNKKFKIIATLITILIVALFIAQFFIGNIAKNAIQTLAPDMLGTSVEVGEINVSLLKGSVEVKNMIIGSPHGFSADNSFKLDRITIETNITSLLTDTFIIKEISIIAPQITYELGIGKTNIGAIEDHVNKNNTSNGTPAENTATNTTDRPQSQKKLIIEDIYITDAKLIPAIGGAGAPIPLPNIHLKDIGKEGNGATFAETSKHILRAVTKSASQVNIGDMGKELGKNVKGIADSLNKLFNK